ncbi:MAG: hypothetical protein D6737_15600 [Chloroflexi bacterium]|nr:MAG: hypothetical protein CUN54_07205 [Phototrophicales bacterium]RMF78173.1 MAG: hypothetical protein D6737_15600 [Chloroflexota bacterium]
MPKQAAKKGTNKALWPVLGLFMAASLGVISWFTAPTIKTLMVDNVAKFRGNELPEDQMQALFAGVIFIVLLGITGLLLAVTIPRDKDAKLSSHKQMMKDRKAMIAEREAKKRRRRMVERENRKY